MDGKLKKSVLGLMTSEDPAVREKANKDFFEVNSMTAPSKKIFFTSELEEEGN